MSAGIMGGFSKIVGEKKVFIDPYVQVVFSGQQVSLNMGATLEFCTVHQNCDTCFPLLSDLQQTNLWDEVPLF